MQELRYILVALGGIAIAALLIHGLWSNKKNRQAPIKEKSLGRAESKSRERGSADLDSGQFDNDGIGQVRVVSAGRRAEPKLPRDEMLASPRRSAVADIDTDDEEDDLPPAVVSQRAHSARSAPQPTPYQAELDDEAAQPLAPELDDEPQEDEPAPPPRKPAQVIRRTPVHRSRPQREPMISAADDEPLREPAYATAPTFGVDSEPLRGHDDHEPIDETPLVVEPVSAERYATEPYLAPQAVEKIWQDVYVINLMARPGQELQGASLISAVTALGLKFGEMDIFHRHEDLDGKGETIFSMINMIKPGTFNPYRMAQFSTPGVSLFMQLPLRSNAAFAFEHMLQAADQLASDLDAMLTDMDRSPLSDEAIARYRHELATYEASRD
ncbi:cell division protein ZipA [Aeromonas cavernicola]|uniref:Cell division protein ZipA n=1 Tax=Aeromonas cavernicola TaxID=1006623 RepID=A0A2H9U361_9GAMM|nr:cell division protein ZipA [Aeromonas cavernicola]PJG58408.1 cell division protein ZipA [Aeromonas cavernicola]